MNCKELGRRGEFGAPDHYRFAVIIKAEDHLLKIYAAKRGNEFMPHYLILWNWTEQGIKNIKDTPARIASARATAEKLRGKVTIHYALGAYDTVGIAEFPDDETLASYLLSVGKLGNVRSTSFKLFSEEEGAALISKLT